MELNVGKYTIFNNEIVDLKIEKDLDYIVTEICKNISPISIILTGSFGRGEGTVVQENGKLHFMSDYEICVVCSKLRTRKICSILSKKMSEELGIATSISWISPTRLRYNRNRNISIGYTNPSIFMYELKAGSRVIYGKNLIKKNIIHPSNINLWEGIKLLLNRMAESFAQYSSNDLESYVKSYWIDKILLACGDILLLHSSQYHYSYQERRNRLISLLDKKKHSFLTKEELKYIIKAYKAKLSGNYKWFRELNLQKVNQLAEVILRFALRNEMHIVFTSFGLFPTTYLNMKSNFYKYYNINFYYLKGPLIENFIYLIKLINWREFPHIKIMYYINIPFHHLIYSVIPPLYFFDLLSKEHKKYIKNFANKIISLFKGNLSSDIICIKREILKIWFKICYGKNV